MFEVIICPFLIFNDKLNEFMPGLKSIFNKTLKRLPIYEWFIIRNVIRSYTNEL